MNFILFTILREYLCCQLLDTCSEKSISSVLPESKTDLYLLLYDMLRENSGSPFEPLFSTSSRLPSYLQALVRGRLERMRNYNEAVDYTYIVCLRSSVFIESPTDMDDGFIVTKDSVFGVFMRKFSLGFHFQTFEQMVNFLDLFFEAYDTNLRDQIQCSSLDIFGFIQSFSRDKYLISNRDHVLEISAKIADAVGRFGCKPNDNFHKYNKMLNLARQLYPDVPEIHYTSHKLAVEKRNLSEAEKELHSYFQTFMATNACGEDCSTICAFMAVSEAAMRLSFKQWNKGKCFEKEALQKALESESKVPLCHVKVAHTLLNSSAEPFRYDDQLASKKLSKSNAIGLAEFRTQFWTMLDSRATPTQLLALYYNSPYAACGYYFAICLLDLANMWLFYGYPILSTTLSQCVINADNLKPCSYSDSVMTNSFANVIQQFNAAGSIGTALQLTNSCKSILCRFPGCSMITEAGLLVELKQNLRSAIDFDHCHRLVNALRLCCPWESGLWQAEVERKRGNYSACYELLCHVADCASSRRDHSDLSHPSAKSHFSKVQSKLASNVCIENDEADPFNHVILPVFPDYIPVGGLCKLAQVESRAYLCLAELYFSLGLYEHASEMISLANQLCEMYHLDLGSKIGQLLAYAVHLQKHQFVDKLENPFGMARNLHEILHRSGRSAQAKYVVLMSRIRIWSHERSHNPEIVSQRNKELKAHAVQLLKVLNYYHLVDDRKFILDTLALLAVALNALGKRSERNEIARLVHVLKQDFYTSCSPILSINMF